MPKTTKATKAKTTKATKAKATKAKAPAPHIHAASLKCLHDSAIMAKEAKAIEEYVDALVRINGGIFVTSGKLSDAK